MTSSRGSYVAAMGALVLGACSGTNGTQGAAGAQGATGAQGAAGPQGPQGAAGAKGDPAFLSNTAVAASLGPIPIVPQVVPGTPVCADGASMDFFGLTADVLQLSAGQRIHASASFDLGGTGGGAASNLTLGICHSQLQADDTVITAPSSQGEFLGDVGGGLPLQIAGNTRLTFSIGRTLLDLAPLANGDKYRVGLCGCIDNAGAWTPGFGIMTVQVFQPAL